MDFESGVKFFQAATGLASVIIAWMAVSRSRESAREQAESARVERWTRDFTVLVREPMMFLLKRACADVEKIVVAAGATYQDFPSQGVIQTSCDEVQQYLLPMRTDLGVICLAADEYELLEGITRSLDSIEDELIELIGSFPTRVPEQHQRRRKVHELFARLERGVIQHGKDGRRRLNTPLKALKP